MYRIVPIVARRLGAALGPNWAIGHGNDYQERLSLPRADVRLVGAGLESTQGRAVRLRASYRIALVVDAGQGDSAFTALDVAVTSVIAALHQWQPHGHMPATARLELQGIGESALLDASVYGYDLVFSLSVVCHGFDPHATDPLAAHPAPTP